ncbi:hypothetical protein [Photobacterium kasasachensis]|uniref:hypothetical protein n=1 Tax=Photobacterium kasasachensis TaxID=2910240 RepID=UPI003D13576D
MQAATAKEQTGIESQCYQDAKTQAETGRILQEMEKLNQEVAQLREQCMAQLQSQIDAIQP